MRGGYIEDRKKERRWTDKYLTNGKRVEHVIPKRSYLHWGASSRGKEPQGGVFT